MIPCNLNVLRKLHLHALESVEKSSSFGERTSLSLFQPSVHPVSPPSSLVTVDTLVCQIHTQGGKGAVEVKVSRHMDRNAQH